MFCQSVIKMSRKVLTLSERVETIKLHDGGKSSWDVAQIMGVGRMQIQQITKRKSEVLDDVHIYIYICKATWWVPLAGTKQL
jgi:hypothetical protein